MFSNTENNSASDSVNTRPKLKAYLNFIDKLKRNEQKVALILGYALTAGLFFGLGKYTATTKPPEIRIEEPAIDLTQIHNNLTGANAQTTITGGADVAGANTDDLECSGKIKGNISSKSKIYHIPGGAFYNRTVPEMCFTTESEARAAGFRKSQR